LPDGNGPDGSRIVALVNIRPLRDHEGLIQGAINCFQDISAHKAVEKDVRKKSADLEDFFENSAIGLHIVGGDGIIQRANKAELALLGYSSEEYVGRQVAEFHADAPVIGDILQKLACGEKLDRYPARLRAKDGSIKHVLITSNSRFQDGKFVMADLVTAFASMGRARCHWLDGARPASGTGMRSGCRRSGPQAYRHGFGQSHCR
jgi:PAS domain S-box-containing protein